MKRTIIGAMVLSLAVGSLALADPPQGYDHRHRDERHHGFEHRHGFERHHGFEHHRPVIAPGRFATGRYVRPYGYYAHAWRRGDRLPPAYRASAYVIPDVAVYHLRPAPPGYYWIRVDDNAVLAAVATGAVVSVRVNLF